MSYTIIAEQNREDVIFYETYGNYEGDFVLVTEKDGFLNIYKDYFGSCSGCDNCLSEFHYDEYVLDSKKVVDFVEQYKPFLSRKISELTYQDIYDGVTINNYRYFTNEEQKELIKSICEKYSIVQQQD